MTTRSEQQLTDGAHAARCMNAGEIIDAPVAEPTIGLPADLIHDDEVVILILKPHPLFIVLGSLSGLAGVAIVTMILAYLARIPWIGWTDAQAFGFGFLLALLRLGWQALDWFNRVFVLTDRRIIRRMGVIRLYVFETPLSNIQHTSVFARLRERLFNLGTIGFATSGSDVYEAFWPMIAKPFAVHKIVLEAIERYGRKRRR